MSTVASGTWSYRTALEAHDVAGMVAHLAEDVVLHSPATSTEFRGREEVTTLYEEVFAALDSSEVLHELADGDLRTLWLRARLGGGEVTLAELFRLDADGKIREITITGRPLAGSALFFKAVGPRYAGRLYGPRRERLVRAMTASFPALLRAVDRLGAKIAR
jgi:predicted SnoaL-like aldol condensation-catalyzing enzyme